MKKHHAVKRILPALIASAALLPASLAVAEDGLEDYRDRFEPLPYLPPIFPLSLQTTP